MSPFLRALACGVCLVLPGSAAASGRFEGRAALELEYLGEYYYSESELPPIPGLDDVDLRIVDTTRFAEDTWLPGQRLELGWIRDLDGGEVALRSATTYNRERFAQGLDGDLVLGERASGRWRFSLQGDLRDEERSLVGHGNWRLRGVVRHDRPLGDGVAGALEAGLEHSRTRGDTTSFLYDYSRVRLRGSLESRGGWFPVWEVHGEASVKDVPGAIAGAYAEGRVGGVWRPSGARRLRLGLDLTLRDYGGDTDVGRDFLEGELEVRARLAGGDTAVLSLEAELEGADYAGEDDLYYDYLELTLHLPWERTGERWTIGVGPRARLLGDLGGEDRDFAQWTARGELGGALGLGGFLQVAVEAGYRDYRGDGAEAIEVTSLSSTFLRTDYWLLETLLLASVPLGGGFSLEVLADSSVESHRGQEERIHVTFGTISIARAF